MPPLKLSQNASANQCFQPYSSQGSITADFFFHMSIRTEIFVIFVKCLIGYVVFLNKYPFFVKKINVKNNFGLKTNWALRFTSFGTK